MTLNSLRSITTCSQSACVVSNLSAGTYFVKILPYCANAIYSWGVGINRNLIREFWSVMKFLVKAQVSKARARWSTTRSWWLVAPGKVDLMSPMSLMKSELTVGSQIPSPNHRLISIHILVGTTNSNVVIPSTEGMNA